MTNPVRRPLANQMAAHDADRPRSAGVMRSWQAEWRRKDGRGMLLSQGNVSTPTAFISSAGRRCRLSTRGIPVFARTEAAPLLPEHGNEVLVLADAAPFPVLLAVE